MAAELRFFRYVTVVKDGLTRMIHGSTSTSQNPVTVNATSTAKDAVLVLPTATVTVWTWSSVDNAKFLMLEASGYLDVSLKIQKPTSGSDKTPAGTPLYIKLSVSNYAPLTLNTDALFNGLFANYNSGHFTGPNNETGYIYEVAVRNPSASTSVSLTTISTD